MAVTRINNNQVSSATTGNVAGGINAAAKIQAYSIVSQNLANDIVIGNSLTVNGNITTANIRTNGYYWANGVAINFSSLNYSNANVANYLPTYNGSLYPDEILTDNYYWANGVAINFGTTLTGMFIGDQQFTANGVGNTYPLNQASTESAMLVSINGVTQYPTISYTTNNANITFNTTPLASDFIDIRFFGTNANSTSTYGNANVAAYLPTYTGNLSAGNIFTVGSSGNISGVDYYFGNIVSVTGNITGSYLFGNGAFLTGIGNSGGGGNVTTGTPDYLLMQQSGGAGQLITQTPQAVEFNAQTARSGNSITYSGGTFTLQAGHTYQLSGSVGGYGRQSAAPPYLRYQWFNVTTNSPIGQIARVDGATQPQAYFGGSTGGTAVSIISPNVTTQVQLIIIDDNEPYDSYTIGSSIQGQSYAEIVVLSSNINNATSGTGPTTGTSSGTPTVTTLQTISVRLNGDTPQFNPVSTMIVQGSGTYIKSGTATYATANASYTAGTWTTFPGAVALSTVGDQCTWIWADSTANATYRITIMRTNPNLFTASIERIA